NGARLLAETGMFRKNTADARLGGSAAGGNLRVEAESIEIDGFKLNDPGTGSGIRTLAHSKTSGNAGDITLITGRLSMTRGAAVLADTRGRGPAGLISIEAIELSISGLNPERTAATLEPDRNQSEFASRISSQTDFSGADGGRGGSLFITAGSVDLNDHGVIRVSAVGAATGAAGRIQISADRVRVASNAMIDSSIGSRSIGGGDIRFGSTVRPVRQLVVDGGKVTATSAGPGIAGRITGSVGTLTIRNGGVINTESLAVGTTSFAAGRAGAISFRAQSLIDIDGSSTIRNSAEDADAGGIRLQVAPTGAGVRVAGQVNSTAKGGQNRGGVVMIDAGRQLTIAPTSALAERPTPESSARDEFRGTRITARSDADGGTILLRSSDSIITRRSLIQGIAGRFGGAITGSSPAVVLDDHTLIDARSLNSVAARAGQPGFLQPTGTPVPVTIQSRGLIRSPDSTILTEAPFFTLNTDIAGTLSAVNADVDDPRNRLVDTCARRLMGGEDDLMTLVADPPSSFIVEGRGGLPLQPGAPMPAVSRTSGGHVQAASAWSPGRPTRP
ncbi:MAG: hypothetical protein NZ561_01005, partial [Phycisphaerae bacterium]|nr:hypothetical protein [Phycisphaerae bacterium]